MDNQWYHIYYIGLETEHVLSDCISASQVEKQICFAKTNKV